MYLNNSQVSCDYYYHSDQSRDEEREYKENLESTRITLSLLAVSDVAYINECNGEVNTPCPYDAVTTTNVPAQAPSPPRILTPAITANIQNSNITTQKTPQTNSKFAQFMAKKKTPYVAEVPTYAHLPSSPTTPTVTDTHKQDLSKQGLSLPHREEEEEEDKENLGHNYDPPSSPSLKGSPIRCSYSRPPRLSSSSTTDDASLTHVTDMNTINEALLSLRLSLTPRRRRSSSHEPAPMHSPTPVQLPYTPLNAPTTTPSVKTRSASQIPRWTPTPATPSLTPVKTATPLSQQQGTQSSNSKSSTKTSGIPKRILPSFTSYTPSTPTPVRTTSVPNTMASATRSGLRYSTATKNASVKDSTGLSTNTPMPTTPVIAKDSTTKAVLKSVKRAISRAQPRTTGKPTLAPAAIVNKGKNYDSTSVVKRRVQAK